MVGHRICDIGYCQNTGLNANLVTLKPMRIARAIHPFVVLEGGLGNRPRKFDPLENLIPGLRMHLDERHLHVAQPARLDQYLHRHGHLADIVEDAGDIDAGDLIFGKPQGTGDGLGKAGHTIRMAAGVRISILDDLGEGLGRAEKALFEGLFVFR
jgi:hypothetical protein